MTKNWASSAASSLLDRAAELLSRKAYRDAHALCMQAIQQAPNDARIYYLLGILTGDHANHAKAIELFDRALALGPARADILAQKARNEIVLLKRDAAVKSADAAAALCPTDAFTLDTLGVVYSRAGLHGRATGFYEAATTAAPGVSAYWYNLGVARQFSGAMEGARKAFRTCIDRDPSEVRALAALVQITRQTPDDNHVTELEDIFPRVQQDPDEALRIGHALAKAHEDMNDPARAMRWLARAKAGKWASVNHKTAFDGAIFAAAMVNDGVSAQDGHADAAPIFIVGMPRTGTTLVDRILSGHSAVTSAGELADFGLSLKQLVGTPSNYVLDADTLEAARRVNPGELGRTYMERVRATLGLTGRFIDKMPLNAVYAPIILSALPNARVICLRRHPADTVLSNYRQMFSTRYPYYDYALNLEAAARYYVGFDRMIRHFSDTLPRDRFTQVHYENIVQDIEGETRRLLAFCDLPFEEDCVAFHKNAAPVATASSAQVRQPLYTSALARWKRYEAELAPALSILREAACLPEAD